MDSIGITLGLYKYYRTLSLLIEIYRKKESMMLAKLLELVTGPEPLPLLTAKSKSVLLWYAGSAPSFM